MRCDLTWLAPTSCKSRQTFKYLSPFSSNWFLNKTCVSPSSFLLKKPILHCNLSLETSKIMVLLLVLIYIGSLTWSWEKGDEDSAPAFPDSIYATFPNKMMENQVRYLNERLRNTWPCWGTAESSEQIGRFKRTVTQKQSKMQANCKKDEIN